MEIAIHEVTISNDVMFVLAFGMPLVISMFFFLAYVWIQLIFPHGG